ncbi:ABC transporter ATP-binding protein [Jiella avicenniae]|uniref:ABC transporter ATP-binding protein n=1 Tax=Jiella avicenniae TaxID=2907202 RepID=A0A9X1T364_9HYPH|nr:ABC transporter ATP-binding protein [Jiella avicenniae]MCE7027131.1 ABC transporter ATP-binding protein [Jiella avicenniae]
MTEALQRTALHAPPPATAPEASVARPLIRIEDVSLTYGRGERKVQALSRTSLDVPNGDFVALVGPSGCGKSTILKIVAQLLSPSEGHVFVAGREIGAVDIRIGMAFQNPTLLPWLSIRDNVMLPLKISQPFRSDWRRKKNGEYRDRADALLAKVGLGGFAGHYPWQLSGGMQQRASLCRALVHEPTLLLLDEPFGALDQFTREELWDVLQALWMEQKPTVLLVTHDLRESAYLANRIVVMSARPGRIIVDETVDYQRPRSIETTFRSDFVELNHRLRSLIFEARAAGSGAIPAGVAA